MLNLRKVAITGGLSCGKSSVCRILKELGAYVVSADEIVHHLLLSDANVSQKVVDLLGKSVLTNNLIDRSLVAERVFRNPRLLTSLEKILHPAVYDEIEQQYQKQQDSNNQFPFFIAEVPLLYESNGAKFFDTIIAVVADQEISLQRFKSQTHKSEEEFQYRMTRQIPPLEKAIRADYVVLNNGTLSELQQSLRELYQELQTYS
jgi:dephospho-CoA kinase